jgi:uncharacterized protein YjbI with pentapeptide repeats
LILSSSKFESGSVFTDLYVHETLQANGARFGNVNFQRVRVAKSALFREDLAGNCAMFFGEADFINSNIGGNFEFDGAEFSAASRFDFIHIAGNGFFRANHKGKRCIFKGDAVFVNANLTGVADFRGAEFHGRAIFTGMTCGSAGLFCVHEKGQRTIFNGEARFLNVRIGYSI